MSIFSDGRTAINSYQFYASRAIMRRMGSSKVAATNNVFELSYAGVLEGKSPLQVLDARIKAHANKVIYERASYTDLNLQRKAGVQTDLYEYSSNSDSAQSRNILP